MSSFISCTLGLLVLGLTVLGADGTRPPKDSPPPKKYVFAIFGDSISDTGNTLRTAGVPDPTIYNDNATVFGRFTNGLNWVDYLGREVAEQVEVSVVNYAYGGGTACPISDQFKTAYPFFRSTPDLGNQTSAFLSALASGALITPRDAKKTKILPIQFIGANDILFGFQEAVTFGTMLDNPGIERLLSATLACKLAPLTALAAAGIKDIVLLSSAPLYLAPSVPPPFVPEFKEVLDLLDGATAQAVGQIQAGWDAAPAGSPVKGARIHLVGDTAWMEGLRQQVQRPAFTHVNGSCFTQPQSFMSITPGLKASICNTPNDFLFFDGTHMTTRYHEALATKGLLPALRKAGLLPK